MATPIRQHAAPAVARRTISLLAQPTINGYSFQTGEHAGHFTAASSSLRRVARSTVNPSHTMTASSFSFQTALLLVDTEQNAAVDRRALREAGLSQVRILTSGLQAARLLAGHSPTEPRYRPDVVLCHKKLADMEGPQLVELVRLHPRLLGLPILLVVNNTDECALLDALSVGGSGVLARPYSQDALCKALHALTCNTTQNLHTAESEVSTGAFDDALRHFDQTLAEAGNPDRTFRNGMQALHDRDWDTAISAFQKAMRQITLKGESELGLAAAWRGKGDMRKYCYYLNEAGHTFARATQWHKARVVYSRLLRTAPNAPSPFLAVAENLIRAGQFDEAAEALAAGYDLGSLKDMPDRLAQACLFTEDPDNSVDQMLGSLRTTPLSAEVAALGCSVREAIMEHADAAQARSRILKTRARRQNALLPDDDDEVIPEAADNLLDMPSELPPAGKAVLSDTTGTPGEGAATSNSGTMAEERPLQKQPSPTEHPRTEASPSPARPAGRGFPTQQRENAPVLRPLKQEDMESTLFSSIPVLNEAITVMRVTWNLLRNAKK